MSIRRLHRGLAATFFVLVPVLASCSSGSSSDASTTTTAQRAGSGSSTTTVPSKPLARYAGYTSAVYSDPAHWVCRPQADDVCKGGLDATVVAADGTLTPQPWKLNPDAPIDCFYVYPTISTEPGDYSDLVVGPEEEFVTLNQAARLGSDCRVFAPVYRQRTLAGLGRSLSGTSSTSTPGTNPDQPYLDVLDAWKQYMAHDNGGRGVVLIGHSQGGGLVTRLVKEEIDPNPDVRSRLVAAYIAGASVAVPEGADVGGTFQHVPACRRNDQSGCVVSWDSYRSTAPPPPNAFFGGVPAGQGVALCNNPAALAGGSAELHSYFPTAPSASILGSLGASTGGTRPWVDPSKGTITTPFVTTPGLVSGECARANDHSYLSLTIHADPADPRRDDIGGDLTPEWGMHLQDIDVVMGDIVSLVQDQARSWTESHG